MFAGIAARGFHEIGGAAEPSRPDVPDIRRETTAELVSQAQAEAGVAQALADAVLVVDPAQSFVGTKTQARREGRWEYYLSTDQYY